MRNYPQLTEQNTTRDFIETFGGLNRNIRITDGEFADMINLTSDYYPTLATRPKRGKTSISDGVETSYDEGREYTLLGLVEKEKLYGVYWFKWGTTWFIMARANGGITTWPQITEYGPNVPRQIVSMGAYIVVFPDGVYFNITKKDDYGRITKKYTSIGYRYEGDTTDTRLMSFSPCDKEGNRFSYAIYNEGDGVLDRFIELGAEKHYKGPVNNMYLVGNPSGKFYYWSETSDMWMSFTPEYMLCMDEYWKDVSGATLLSGVFSPGDGVRFSGFDKDNEEDARILKEVFDDNIDRPIYVEKIVENENDVGIVLKISPKLKIVDNSGINTESEIVIETIVPKMDYVIESGNRLWGCRYGENNNGDVVNEIYASKLGDFKNWETFAGVSTDSYAASLGSDGAFTGATTYLGYPLFFKQNCIHTVYGNFPAQYQIQTTECRGVQQGCEKSLVTLDGALLYKAVGGVCAYTGSLPTEIGSQLNEKGIQFTDAIAGTYHHKYYLAMKDSEKGDGKHWLYVYDTNKGLWHKESPIDIARFCEVSAAGVSELYYYNGSDLQIHQIIGNENTTNEDKVGWYAETGIMGCSSPDKKYISRLSLRLSMGIGTRVYVSAEYDSSGVWEQIAVIVGSKLGTFTIPIRPKRCDHLRLRLEGDDEVKIYSISKTMEQGSDV